jgi:hypothetical protein
MESKNSNIGVEQKTAILESWNLGILEYWNLGILEYWNLGIKSIFSIFKKNGWLRKLLFLRNKLCLVII